MIFDDIVINNSISSKSRSNHNDVEDKIRSAALLIGSKNGIEALLKSCEEANKLGSLSIDTVRFIAEYQLKILNEQLEELK